MAKAEHESVRNITSFPDYVDALFLKGWSSMQGQESLLTAQIEPVQYTSSPSIDSNNHLAALPSELLLDRSASFDFSAEDFPWMGIRSLEKDDFP